MWSNFPIHRRKIKVKLCSIYGEKIWRKTELMHNSTVNCAWISQVLSKSSTGAYFVVSFWPFTMWRSTINVQCSCRTSIRTRIRNSCRKTRICVHHSDNRNPFRLKNHPDPKGGSKSRVIRAKAGSNKAKKNPKKTHKKTIPPLLPRHSGAPRPLAPLRLYNS